MTTMNTLDEIAARVRVCPDCGLSQSRTKAVPGEGPPNAAVMFIGEGPGFNEDQQGRPFVGAAGRYLEKLLESIGLRREDVFITNVVKCRPPNNRDPLPSEIKACSKYLDRQIELINPKIIVTLGRYSLARFFPNETITKARGKPRQYQHYTVFPMFHPAAALRREDLKPVLEQDMKRLASLLKEPPKKQEQPATGSSQQLSMF